MIKRYQHPLICLAVFVVLVILLNKFAISPVRNTFYFISAPLEKAFGGVGDSLAKFFSSFFYSQTLVETNRQLNRENFFLKYKLTELFRLEEENQDLREALGLGLSKGFDLGLVEVISKETGQDIILVNQGLQQGIEEGMPVITVERVLVGRVEESLASFAKVALISSPENSFDIEIEGKQMVGLAKGEGDFRVSLDKVAKEAPLEEGDIVLTSNLSGKFPRGLLVGEVKSIRKSDAEIFQQGEIAPYFVKGGFNRLLIIKDFAQDN